MSGDQIRTGMRLKSVTCGVEVIVVKAPAGTAMLMCGGQPMVTAGTAADPAPLDDAWASGTVVGKRYVNSEETVEVLCMKPGAGSLGLDGAALNAKEAKPLPSSD